jgi:hypothetical protein
MLFQIELGRLVEEEMKKKDEALGGVLDTLLTQAAMLIIQQSRGGQAVLNTLLEASSDQTCQPIFRGDAATAARAADAMTAPIKGT